MPSGFKRIQLASTQDHPENNDNVKRWTESNGGIYTGTHLTETTTHLLCSKKAWNRSDSLVVEARKRNIPVVTMDWFMDAFRFHHGNAIIRDVAKYDLTQTKLKKTVRKKTEKQTVLPAPRDALSAETMVKKFQEKGLQTETTLASKGYEIYTDANQFTYSFALLRPDTAEVVRRYSVSSPSSFLYNALPLPTIIRRPAYDIHPCPPTVHHPPPASSFSHLPSYAVLPHPSRLLHTAVPEPDPAIFCLQLYTVACLDNDPLGYCLVEFLVDDAFGEPVQVKELVMQGCTVKSHALDMWKRIFRGRTGLEWGVVAAKGDGARSGKWTWDGKEVRWVMLDADGREALGAQQAVAEDATVTLKERYPAGLEKDGNKPRNGTSRAPQTMVRGGGVKKMKQQRLPVQRLKKVAAPLDCESSP